MVIWLFAGGGEAEVRGLIPFLEKNFTCVFERKTPIRQKPGPKPTNDAAFIGYGRTGSSLANQITEQLKAALMRGEKGDLILVIDDLDCHDPDQQRRKFLQAIDVVSNNIARYIGFAAPELEAWLIADWGNTIAKDVDLRANHEGIRWWLSQKVPFVTPESFSSFDPDKNSCHEKLSDLIIDAALEKGIRYSKAIHTPRLLEKVTPEIVSAKCPLFKELYLYLSEFCADDKG